MIVATEAVVGISRAAWASVDPSIGRNATMGVSGGANSSKAPLCSIASARRRNGAIETFAVRKEAPVFCYGGTLLGRLQADRRSPRARTFRFERDILGPFEMLDKPL